MELDKKDPDTRGCKFCSNSNVEEPTMIQGPDLQLTWPLNAYDDAYLDEVYLDESSHAMRRHKYCFWQPDNVWGSPEGSKGGCRNEGVGAGCIHQLQSMLLLIQQRLPHLLIMLQIYFQASWQAPHI